MVLSMYLKEKKAGYLSVEEFATLVQVQSFMPLGDTKEEITETLEIFISGERGLGTEFNEHEQADVKTIIKKVQTLDDEQVAQLAEAFEQAEKLWNIFTFVNPIERLDIEEEKADGLEKICKDSMKTANEAVEISNRAMEIVQETVEKI